MKKSAFWTQRRSIFVWRSFSSPKLGEEHAAFARLDEQRQAALAADLEATWSEKNQAAGDRTHVYSEYLEVIATRA